MTASVNSTDSVRQTVAEVRVDSVYVRDSIYIRERGDTVFVDRWHVRWREHAATKADTVYVENNRASCTVHREPPERYVPKFYKWCTGILLALLAAAVVSMALKIAQKKRLRTRTTAYTKTAQKGI